MIPQRTRPASRGLLLQAEVRSVFVIVGDEIREKSLQMSLVQRDCVVEQLTATAANPALSHSILPRTSNRSTHRCDLQRANSAGHFEPVVVRKTPSVRPQKIRPDVTLLHSCRKGSEPSFWGYLKCC